MKKSKTMMFTSLAALGIATLFLIGSSSANFGGIGNRQGPMGNLSEVSSYTEFLETIEGTRMEGKITEEKFNEMKEKQQEREEKRTAVEEAIQNHDYTAWKELHEDMDILEQIDTEEKFEKLIEMHAIMQDARTYMENAREKADVIATELLIERGIGQKENKMKTRDDQGLMGIRGGFGMNK